MKKLLIILFLLVSPLIHGTVYYVATTGNDSNPGTISQPWATWQKAFMTAEPYDTVYFRGGVWYPTQGYGGGNNIIVMQPRTGTDPYNNLPYSNHIGHDNTTFLNYPGEVPILDCSNVFPETPANDYITGIQIYWGNYITIKGLVIRNIYDRNQHVTCNGINIYGGSNYILENVSIHDVDGEGLYIALGGGYTSYGSGIQTDTSKVINTDIYNCWNHTDLGSNLGGWADGVKATNPSVPDYDGCLIFDGCRVWNCSDDAFDPGGAGLLIIRNCWAFDNGHLDGDGTGIKTGPSSSGYSPPFINRLIHNNLLVWNHVGIFEVEYPNYARMNARIYNNTIYKCDWGISISDNVNYPVSKTVFYNNIIYQMLDLDNGGRPYVIEGAGTVFETHNNNFKYQLYGSLPPWAWNTAVTVTDADFVLAAETPTDSITAYAQLSAPRNADYTLPEVTFLTLATGSDLIDAGTAALTDTANLDIEFSGAAPDMGYAEYESGESTPVTSITVSGTGGATTISTDNGTLQMLAAILPEDATVKTILWTVIDGSGYASISSTGLLTAVSDGLVTVRASATDGSGVYDDQIITISNQTNPVIAVTSITVTGEGGSTSINTYQGTLQMSASVMPENATDKIVVWSRINGTGTASISSSGLVTAITEGTVTIRATARDGSGVYDDQVITIGNQTPPVIPTPSTSRKIARPNDDLHKGMLMRDGSKAKVD